MVPVAVIVVIVIIVLALAITLPVVLIKSKSTPTATETPVQNIYIPSEPNRIMPDLLEGDEFGSRLMRVGPDWTAYSNRRTYQYDHNVLRFTRDPGYYAGYTVHEGVLSHEGRELHYDSEMKYIVDVADDVVTIVCDSKVIEWDGTLTIVADRMEVIDAYRSGKFLVVLTPNNVVWYENGVEVNFLVTRGASICEVSGQVCAVGIPQEERVIICSPGIIVDSIVIPGEAGYTEFGYAVDYWDGFLVVGAPAEGFGKVYVYDNDNGFFLYRDVIDTVDAPDRSRFGDQVMISKHRYVAVTLTNVANRGAIDVVRPSCWE